MKKLRSLQGGYPRQQDYLLTLQNELTTMADALFAKLGVDMVLKGCDILDNGNGTVNVSAGIIYVGGEVLRFDAANNVVGDGTKTFVKSAPANTDAKLFANGASQEVYSEVKVVVGNKTSVTEVAIKPAALYNLATYIQDIVASYAHKGDIKQIYDFDGTFLANFDESGLGVTPRFSNWAMLNGNNDTPNAGGRALVSVGKFTDPSDGAVYNYGHGAEGGEVEHKLIISELPRFKPQFRHGKSKRGTTGSEELVDKFSNGFITQCDEIGGDQKHNNMQPYLAVYTIVKII